MSNEKTLIKCRQLTLGYGSKDLVRDLDYDVNAGDYLCIVGRNGSGKTTFLRGIAGLLKPKSGIIELCDGLSRNQIGYLPQMTIVQKDFPASVEEIVLSAFQGKHRLLPFYRKAHRDRAMECMALTRTESRPRIYRNDVPHHRKPASAGNDRRHGHSRCGYRPGRRHPCARLQHHFGEGEIIMPELLEKLSFYLDFPFVRYAIIVGVLVSLCSSLLGVTLVLKRYSYIGDGLSHVAFGALSIAAVLKITNNMLLILPVTIAVAVLLLCTGKNARIKGDAAIAMVSVGALAIGYLLMNVFSTSANISGDVCTTLFGSTSILTLRIEEVYLCVALSIAVLAVFILFYHKIFAITFDENFAQATGVWWVPSWYLPWWYFRRFRLCAFSRVSLR